MVMLLLVRGDSEIPDTHGRMILKHRFADSRQKEGAFPILLAVHRENHLAARERLLRELESRVGQLNSKPGVCGSYALTMNSIGICGSGATPNSFLFSVTGHSRRLEPAYFSIHSDSPSL